MRNSPLIRLRRLEEDSILHIKFQSANDPRTGSSHGHVRFAQRVRAPLWHAVLYVGRSRMTMESRLNTGPLQFAYELLDIRDIAVDALLRSGNPADCALAILAGGGRERLSDIVRRIARLDGPRRDRALAQLVVLSGLRAHPREIVREVMDMSVVIDWRKNAVLVHWWKKAVAEGREEGLEEGRQEGVEEGMRIVLTEMIETKFGKLPKWARDRVARGSVAQLGNWAKKVVTADTLEGVLGRRPKPTARRTRA